MIFKKILTKLVLAVAVTGIVAPLADASKYSRMVRNKTNAINKAISDLQKRASQLGVTAIAAEFQGVYAPVGRQNDIFVFCERGMNDYPEMHFWRSVNPIAGSFQVTNWYSVNYQYIPYFVVLCPYARKQGSWQGPGQGMQYKANPSYDSSIGGSPVTPLLH